MASTNGGSSSSAISFQSFSQSHFTLPPPTKRIIYTQEQKDEAIRLLNEGTPVKKVAAWTSLTCSKSNPYRWRDEEKRAREVAERAQVAAVVPGPAPPLTLDDLLCIMVLLALLLLCLFVVGYLMLIASELCTWCRMQFPTNGEFYNFRGRTYYYYDGEFYDTYAYYYRNGYRY